MGRTSNFSAWTTYFEPALSTAALKGKDHVCTGVKKDAQLYQVDDSSLTTGMGSVKRGDIVDVIPLTENFSFYDEETQSMQDWEEYTFVLTLDNLAEMYDINTPPISDFTYAVTGQGIPPEGSPPMANFTWNSN